MQTVTVAGAHGQTVTLNFDTDANADLARKLAAAITAGVNDTSIVPVDRTGIFPPPVPSGKTGELVQQTNGLTILSKGYDAVVDTANNAVIYGSGDKDESVLSSTGNLKFFAPGGSGTVAAGGGNNLIVISPADKGGWSINTGNGNDQILALGSGDDTINPGGGNNAISLGDGNNVVESTGDDTVVAGSGAETIAAFGPQILIYGNASKLNFTDVSGSATVIGGTGSDTFFGADGPDFVRGGTGGNNFLMAGFGGATLYGGGNGDQLYANGDQGQALHAGGGNETLVGAFSGGADTFYGGSGKTQIIGGSGNDTFVAGTGAATVTAGIGQDMFVFNNGQAGGKELVFNFTSGQDTIDLQGYGKHAIDQALDSQKVKGNTDTITLSDNTQVTFVGVTNLTASDFIATPGTGDDGDHDHGSGHGHGHGHGHGNGDSDGSDHVRNIVTGHSQS